MTVKKLLAQDEVGSLILKAPEVLHAESNAIAKLAKSMKVVMMLHYLLPQLFIVQN